MKIKYSIVFWFVFPVLAGCSALDLGDRTPSGASFSGEWMLNISLSDSLEVGREGLENKQAEYQIRSENLSRPQTSNPFVFISHDFNVLDADRLKIELGPDSVGLRYYPGVYRDVTFGTRDRGLWKVYSGWEDDQMVVLSLAKDLRVMERFSLVSQNRLKILIDINADKGKKSLVKVFDRVREFPG